jgi:D-amino-acid dehydrogenase
MAEGLGVTFRYGVGIDGLEAEAGRIVAVRTSAGRVTADAFVVALGSYSPALVAPLGIRLPVYPVKGYSITVPIVDAARAPVSTVMDETHKIAITRLGDRIRVGGMAELAGFDLSLKAKRQATLTHSVEDLFGGAGDQSKASFWCGLRPMTPDGTPVVGRSPVQNLFLNTGHGTLGWTMAAGSGRVLADIVSGHRTEIEARDLGYARYLRDVRGGRMQGAGQVIPA